MDVITKGYYHCLECGAVFEALVKDFSEHRCSVCGNPPTGKVLAGTAEGQFVSELPKEIRQELSPKPSSKLHGVNQDTQNIDEATMATMNTLKEPQNGRVRRTKRKDKKSSKLWVLVVIWVVVMGGVVGMVKHFGSDETDATSDRLAMIESEKRQAALVDENRKLLVESAIPACRHAMTEFFNATSTAAKAQLVYQGVSLSGEMNRYYKNALGFSAASSQVKIESANLLDGFPMSAIGALCVNEQGEKWEVVFVFVDREWKIDWRSLVRYDAQAWSLFPAAHDGAEGEFRLYLRVRDSNEDLEKKEMSVVFYKPTMLLKNEFRGVSSSPVSVLIDSKLGKSIAPLILVDKEDLDQERQDQHGLRIGLIDPSRYHRVRVKMKLHKESSNDRHARLELLEILSHDWYGIPSEKGEFSN